MKKIWEHQFQTLVEFGWNDPTLLLYFTSISVLPVVSKIFDGQLQKQIMPYIYQFLSKFLCGYRKGYSTKTALISMLQIWRNRLDIKGYAGAILLDLSKASVTINYELLLAKLHADSFSMHSLMILSSYLSNRKQRLKIASIAS